MGKYTTQKVAGYWLYYTTTCLNERIIHVHANSPKPTRSGAAKIWVYEDGSTSVAEQGKVSDRDMKVIRDWIYSNIDLIEYEWKSNGQGGVFKQK